MPEWSVRNILDVCVCALKIGSTMRADWEARGIQEEHYWMETIVVVLLYVVSVKIDKVFSQWIHCSSKVDTYL